jgi:hypothetical protein
MKKILENIIYDNDKYKQIKEKRRILEKILNKYESEFLYDLKKSKTRTSDKEHYQNYFKKVTERLIITFKI